MDLKKQCDTIKQGLENTFLTLMENATLEELKKFIKKCSEAETYFQSQLRLKIPIGVKKSIERKFERIVSLRVAAIQKLLAIQNSSDIIDDITFEEVESAFQNRLRTGVVVNLKHIDVGQFMDRSKDTVINYIRRVMKEHKCLKICVNFCGKFINKGEELDKNFDTKYQEVFLTTDLDEWFIEKVKGKILTLLEEFEDCGSGWSLLGISHLVIMVNKYNPIKGSSWIDLPKWIKDKKGVINVQVYDNTCFAVAIMSALNPVTDSSKNQSRLNSYPSYRDYLEFGDIEFPVALKDIPKFEKLNKNISVNVFIIDEHLDGKKMKHEVLPVHLTNEKKENHVNLLLVSENENNHYCWIKNLSRLVSTQCTKWRKKKIICDRCLHYFYTKEKLIIHQELCSRINKCAVKLPKPEDATLKFKNHARKLAVPFIIFADCESLLKPVSAPELAPSSAYQQHQIYSIGYYLHCNYDSSLSRYQSNRSQGCASWFANELKKIAYEVDEVTLL